jgi:hypothetical protein
MNSVRLDVWSSDDFEDSRSHKPFIGNNFSEMDNLKRRHTTQKEGHEPIPLEPVDLDENCKTQKPARSPSTKVNNEKSI